VESVHLGTESTLKFTPQLLIQFNTCTINGYLESKVGELGWDVVRDLVLATDIMYAVICCFLAFAI
jgi:hypothetical protein